MSQNINRGYFPNASSKIVQSGGRASHVRERRASTVVDQLLFARFNDPPDRPSVLGQDKPMRRLTNNSAAAASSVSACAPCPLNSLLIRSSFNPLDGIPRHHNAVRSSSRRVASLNKPNLSRWQYRWALSSGGVTTTLVPTTACPSSCWHAPHDQPHDLVCKAHRCHAVGTRVEVVSLDTRNQGCDHNPHRTQSRSKFRQQLFNPSRRQMLRHQVRHVFIRGNSLQQELPLSASVPVSTCVGPPSA